MTRNTMPALLIGAALCALATAPLQAQPDWYQVEVILFSQTDTLKHEKNLKSVQLRYPRPQVFLNSGHNENDSSGPVSAAAKTPRGNSVSPEGLDQPLQQPDNLAPEPFATLPASEHQLNAEASRLKHSGPFRILFHQAWRQTLGGPRNSPWLVIQGGNKSGDHYELEGSLRLYSDTHIVAQTLLWHSHFGPPASNSQTADSGTVSPTATTPPQPGSAVTGPPTDKSWPRLPPEPQPPQQQLPAHHHQVTGLSAGSNEASQRTPSAAHFTVVDIDLLETKQVINSQELHYIDHPRLGALIRITPYLAEQSALKESAPEAAGAALPESEKELSPNAVLSNNDSTEAQD